MFIRTNRKLKPTTLCVFGVTVFFLFFKEIGNILSELVTITNLMSKFYETFFVFHHSTTSVCVCQ